MSQPYDIIGDIHGHAKELEQLLDVLGYMKGAGGYRHPADRKVIFLGDFIDRGPEIRSVLRTVREMVDAGNALTILGNHEMNAMRYHATGSDGQPLRPHTFTNKKQHQETLEQFPDRDEWNGWIEWFAGLPLFLDLGGLRIVHACWDSKSVADLKSIGRWEGADLEAYSRKDTPKHFTISQILNGPEARMPEGHLHKTADGTMRRDFRVKWWEDLAGATCREAIFPFSEAAPELPPDFMPSTGYPEDAPPTFFGHYALKDTTPAPIRGNLACLDYGTGKGGFLCAYRWDGEQQIDSSKFVTSLQRKNGRMRDIRLPDQIGRVIGGDKTNSGASHEVATTIPWPRDEATEGRQSDGAFEAYFIRHAESLGNAGFATEDPSTIALSETGERQAKALAATISAVPSIIACSPFLRARQTAEPLIARFPAAATLSIPIQEFTYLAPDSWRGSTGAERRPAVDEYWRLADPYSCDGEGAESFEGFFDRIERTLEWLQHQKSKVVFLVCHEMFIRGVLWRCLSPTHNHAISTMQQFRAWQLATPLPNTSVTKVACSGSGVVSISPPFGLAVSAAR